MKTIGITELLQQPAGETIAAVHGTLTQLYEVHTGEGQYGRWTLQNGVLSDGHDTIKICFANREPVDERWRGQEIVISATENKKGGLAGLKLEKEDYAGKRRLVLRVTAAAEIATILAPPGPENPGPEVPPASAAGGSAAPTAPPPNDDAVRMVRTRLAQRASLMLLTLDAVGYIADQYHRHHGRVLPDALYGTIIGSLYISIERGGVPELPTRLPASPSTAPPRRDSHQTPPPGGSPADEVPF
jgi:hypothetical protein